MNGTWDGPLDPRRQTTKDVGPGRAVEGPGQDRRARLASRFSPTTRLLEIGQTLDTPLGRLPLGLAMSLRYGSAAVVAVLVVGASYDLLAAFVLGVLWFLTSSWSAWPISSRSASD